jgi:hypothetical protein
VFAMANLPSTYQIIKKDHRCFWLLLFLVFWWVVMGILWWFQITHPSRAPNENVLTAIFGLFSLAITIVIAGYVSLRIRKITKTFNTGVEVKGQVKYIGPNSEDVWFVEFEYSYEGEMFKGNQTVGDETSSRKFEKGKDVILLVDPKTPATSYIKDIYIP